MRGMHKYACSLSETMGSPWETAMGHCAEVSVLHGRPWGFFGPPVPLPAKNRTRSRGRGNFTATGAGPLRDPVFPRALRVTGFQAIAGIWKYRGTRLVFPMLATCNKKNR